MLPERDIISHYLSKIFDSQDFATSKRLTRLLQYIVDAKMSGNEEMIKGYTIALDVFDRPASFDPNIDSIVRVQAGRLRKALENYYLEEGKFDTLRIHMPKGGYRILFDQMDLQPQLVQEKTAPVINRQHKPLVKGQQISVGVLPFSVLSCDDDANIMADDLADEIISMLTRNEAMSIASRHASFRHREPTDLRQVGEALGVRYLVDGRVRCDGNMARINVFLIDAVSGINLWNYRFESPLGASFDQLDTLAIKIVMALRMQLYLAAKREVQNKTAKQRTPWEMFLLSTWMPDDTTYSLEHELAHVDQARKILEMDPSSGKAHSILADKLAFLANIDPQSDTVENRLAAENHARLAMDLEPQNADVSFNVAAHFWHMGEFEQSLLCAKTTLELEPHHLLESFLVKSIPYSNKNVPDDIIEDLIATDRDMPQGIMEHWVTLSTISLMYLNNGAYKEAADFGWRGRAVFSARSPATTIWLCCALVQLGEVETACDLIDNAMKYWPSLNLHHYAEIVVPRHYAGSLIMPRMQRDYRALASAVSINKRPGAPRAQFKMIEGGKK